MLINPKSALTSMPQQEIQSILDLKEGDILLNEMLYEDATLEDMLYLHLTSKCNFLSVLFSIKRHVEVQAWQAKVI